MQNEEKGFIVSMILAEVKTSKQSGSTSGDKRRSNWQMVLGRRLKICPQKKKTSRLSVRHTRSSPLYFYQIIKF